MVRGLAREGATDSPRESKRRARPSQALILRLVRVASRQSPEAEPLVKKALPRVLGRF
jgi:hypothetical protein